MLPRERRGYGGGNEIGHARVKNEVVEIDMAPWRTVRFVDEADENLLTLHRRKIDDLTPQNIRVGTCRAMQDRAGCGVHDLDARAIRIFAAAHHKARPRLADAKSR